MEDFADILHRDYGLMPGGKNAPMAGGRHTRAGSSSGGGSMGRSGSASRMAGDDVFGGSGFSSSSFNGGGVRCVKQSVAPVFEDDARVCVRVAFFDDCWGLDVH